MDLKPIETRYKGYRFRSRLEARWAVFFDSLGVQWEYEKEGYDLGSAGWYLPDFWLPKEQAWIEIRPRDAYSAVDARCEALANTTGQTVLLVAGNPWRHDYLIRLYGDGDWDPYNPFEFALGRRDRTNLFLIDVAEGASYIGFPGGDDGWKYPLADCEELRIAYEAARGARFEYGESPR